MTGHEQDTELHDSTPNADGPDGAAGDMGVSSERVGHAGPGQTSTNGLRDDSLVEPDAGPDADVPPEQRPGAVEPKPEGIEPAAGYPSLDPRSDRKPFKDA